MPKYKGSLRRAIDDNSRNKCKLSSCQQSRYRISGYCFKHSRALQEWGHPCGKSVPDKELVTSFDQVSAIIDNNKGHKGIQEAVRFFETWMKQATFSLDSPLTLVPCARHLARLYYAEVPALDLLKAVASVWLYYTTHSRSMVFSDAHCRAVMGHKVCKFIPINQKLEKFVSGKERKTAGKFIQESIGVLLVNIADAAKKQSERRQARLQAMGSEFEI